MQVVESLRRGFEPAAVAILGASRDPAKFSHWLLAALLRCGYPGAVYPINPSAHEILGLKCYARISEVPSRVDLAGIFLPAGQVASALAECVKMHVPLVVVFASGFSESGPEGAKLEAELLSTIAGSGTHLVGPNSLGIINTSAQLVMSFGREIVRRDHPPGRIAFITQSGAFGQALYCWAQDQNLGLSKFVSTGNEADLSSADYLRYLAEDPETAVIMMYIEGTKKGQDFMQAARWATSRKPVLALKVGRTSAGRRAAASHTGALVGQDEVYDAVFRQVGILRVGDAEEMFDVAKVLTWQPLPAGNRVGIVTSSGGIGVETADACERAGLEVPVLSDAVLEPLRIQLPAFAALANPIDLTSQVHLNPCWFREAVHRLLESREVDAVVVGISAFRDVEIAVQVLEATRGSDKPVLVSWTIGRVAQEAMDTLEAAGIPVYPTPERAVRALARAWQYARYLRRRPAVKGGMAI